MKEYVIIIIVSVGMFFLFLLFNKYKSPQYRVISSLIGIIVFAAMFISEAIRKKGINDSDILISFLLVFALIIFLSGQALKSYRELKRK